MSDKLLDLRKCVFAGEALDKNEPVRKGTYHLVKSIADAVSKLISVKLRPKDTCPHTECA